MSTDARENVVYESGISQQEVSPLSMRRRDKGRCGRRQSKNGGSRIKSIKKRSLCYSSHQQLEWLHPDKEILGTAESAVRKRLLLKLDGGLRNML